MAITKQLARQDTDFAISIGNNNETSIKISDDIVPLFLDELPDEDRTKFQVSFFIYKEDFVKSACGIISSLPLYSKHGETRKFDLEQSLSMLEKVNEFFGNSTHKRYDAELVYYFSRNCCLQGFDRKFNIRAYTVEQWSSLSFSKDKNGNVHVRLLFSKDNEPLSENEEERTPSSLDNNNNPYPLQQIYYGAPGTGKSFAINKKTEGMGDNVIRTTFHPDSDYSTFVGAYKPTKQVVKLRDSSGHVIKDYNEETGRTEEVTEDRIVYKFVAQAFVRAYTRAWRNFAETPEGEQPQPVFLVIEEINRGNCAQIFGDLFQLLDRNDKGFSDYPIVADSDMRGYLFGAMSQARAGLDENCDNDSRKVYNKNRLDAINALYKRKVMEDVLSGNALMLPSNLCIWATMNTSDQSLFPIDSAFKRRWDWKYVPIDTAKEEWTLEVNNKKYDWTDFLEKINVEISNVTHSEDKMLGFFFCRADDDKVISAEKFVSKVLFYLYNDVFKDYGFDRDLFKGADGTLQFRDFYETNGTIKEDVVERFLENLKVEPLEEDADDEEQDTEEDEA